MNHINISCQEWVELVTDFLDETLVSDAGARFLGHLAMCDGCRTYLDQFQQTIHALGSLPGGVASTDVRDALLTVIRDGPAETDRPAARDDNDDDDDDLDRGREHP